LTFTCRYTAAKRCFRCFGSVSWFIPSKIIALTADTRWALRDQMIAGGVDGYLLKPVSLSELGKELTRLMPAKRKS
jgi:CheY-like chemotaxis protein